MENCSGTGDHVGVGSEQFPQKERIDELVRCYTKVKGVFVDDGFLVHGNARHTL